MGFNSFLLFIISFFYFVFSSVYCLNINTINQLLNLERTLNNQKGDSSKSNINTIVFSKIISQLISKLETSKIDSHTFGISFNSNTPQETHFFIHNITLLNKSSIFMSISSGIFDYEFSSYVNIVLLPYFLQAFNENIFLDISIDKRIGHSFQRAISHIDNDLLHLSLSKCYEEQRQYADIGASLLSVLIIEDKLFTVNLGDSRARLFVRENNKENLKFSYQKVSKVFLARKRNELKRIGEKWGNMSDLVRCQRITKKCYIKNTLEQTRTIGDYSFKYPFFEIGFFFHIKNNNILNEITKRYRGPFVDSEPDIHVYKIKRNDKLLILGTSEFWDFIKSREIKELLPEIINNTVSNEWNEVEKIGYGLVERVVKKASDKKGKEYEEVVNMRKSSELKEIIKDLCIIVCDIEKLMKLL